MNRWNIEQLPEATNNGEGANGHAAARYFATIS